MSCHELYSACCDSTPIALLLCFADLMIKHDARLRFDVMEGSGALEDKTKGQLIGPLSLD